MAMNEKANSDINKDIVNVSININDIKI